MFGFSIYINFTEKDFSLKGEKYIFENIIMYYTKFSKFSNDKIFTETNDLVIGIDGVILNLQNLKNTYGISDYTKLITHLFLKKGIQFVALLKGEFSGFIFEKKSKTLLFFNNKTKTKQVFYTQFDQKIIISPSIETIINAKQQLELPSYLDIKSSYNMLTYGGMIENKTLVKEIYKLGAGEYLKIENAKLKLKTYHTFNDIDYTIENKKKAIDKLDEAFTAALKLEYLKDEEYGYKHLATLSGGLDSRMNVMIAYKLGFKNHTFCFSQPDYLDEKIARKIATDLGLGFDFYSLEKATHLLSLEKMLSINNGLQFYLGSAHYHAVIDRMDLSDYGLMHTGQIGDAVLGGFVTGNKTIQTKLISNKLAGKSVVNASIVGKYANEEVYNLYQRLFNLTNYGSYVVENSKTYLVSPFLDDDFIKIALSIHPKLKHQQAIYIDWINMKHKDISKYKWERTGFRPNKNWKYDLSRYTKKAKKEFSKLLNKTENLNMCPDDYYYNQSIVIQEYYTNFFKKNITLVYDNKELFSDMNMLYKEGNVVEKSMILSVLEIIRKFSLTI